MEIFDKILWGVAIWTFIEGGILLCIPRFSIRIAHIFFRKIATLLEDMELSELRKYGAIECGFGLCLGTYLFFMA